MYPSADRSRPSLPLPDRILDTLSRSHEPISRTALRSLLGVQNQRLGQALAKLEAIGRTHRSTRGWHC